MRGTTQTPAQVYLGYTMDSVWRNRSEFLLGRPAIVQFLTRKWNKEFDYRLIKELWAFTADRIAECVSPTSGTTTRATGSGPTETKTGSLTRTGSCGGVSPALNDLPIQVAERKYHWPSGRRPDDRAGLSELGL